jgi:hypothetical protein
MCLSLEGLLEGVVIDLHDWGLALTQRQWLTTSPRGIRVHTPFVSRSFCFGIALALAPPMCFRPTPTLTQRPMCGSWFSFDPRPLETKGDDA